MISVPSTTTAPTTDLTDPSKVTPLQLVVTPHQAPLGNYLSPPPSYPGDVQTRPLNLVEGGTVSAPPLLTLPPLAALRPLPPIQLLNDNELAQNVHDQRAGSVGWGGANAGATPIQTGRVADNIPHAQSRTARSRVE